MSSLLVAEAAPTFAVSCGSPGEIDACPEADFLFGVVFCALVEPTPEDFSYERVGYCIVTDEAEEAVLLQKGNGIASTIALKPVVINDSLFAAGSLLHMKLKHPDPEFDPAYKHALRRNQCHAETSDIDQLAFVRETAFCLRVEDRPKYPVIEALTFISRYTSIRGVQAHQTITIEAVQAAATRKIAPPTAA